MSLSSWLSLTFSRSHAGRAKHRNRSSRFKTARVFLEQLETRVTPSLSYSLSTLASFNGANLTGGHGLTMDTSGNLYGTTATGTADHPGGTVFEIAKGSGTITTLALFSGEYPGSGLIIDSSGNLYGTTPYGGPSNSHFYYGVGTVFELANGSNTITTLASFNLSASNGAYPVGGLLMDSSGNLYGTASIGGANTSSYFPNGAGTIFELAQGSGTITALASFNGSNGADPVGALIMDGSGNLYGAAQYGGAGFGSTNFPKGEGTVFELAQGSVTITTLASFNGTNGALPRGGLVIDSGGNMYGTTYNGGPAWNPGKNGGNGTVFEVAVGSGTVTDPASFNGSNGRWPNAGLVMDTSGNLFGTTFEGGATWNPHNVGDGSIFEVAKGSGAVTTLASFNGSNGSLPVTGLIMDSSGHFYGSTLGGSVNNDGSVFELANGPSFAITGPSGVTAGTAATFTLTALNADGTVNTGYSGTVQITSSDPNAVLPGNLAISGGTGTFNVTLETAYAESITATDVNNPSMTGFAIGVAVSPAAATHFIISGPSSVAAGTLFSITVTAVDAYGNIATGYRGTVHFADSLGGATLPGNYTFNASDNGVHTFTSVKLKTKGMQTITIVDILNNTILGTLWINVI